MIFVPLAITVKLVTLLHRTAHVRVASIVLKALVSIGSLALLGSMEVAQDCKPKTSAQHVTQGNIAMPKL